MPIFWGDYRRQTRIKYIILQWAVHNKMAYFDCNADTIIIVAAQHRKTPLSTCALFVIPLESICIINISA